MRRIAEGWAGQGHAGLAWRTPQCVDGTARHLLQAWWRAIAMASGYWDNRQNVTCANLASLAQGSQMVLSPLLIAPGQEPNEVDMAGA